MTHAKVLTRFLCAAAVAFAVSPASAQNTTAKPSNTGSTRSQDSSTHQTTPPPRNTTPPPETTHRETKVTVEEKKTDMFGGYRGLSDFFNVREANSNVEKCEWEFEALFGWSTRSGETDTVGMEQSLKYGITDDLHVELAVVEPLGEAGEGVGELYFQVFNTFWRESELIPAFGGWAEMRIPSGYESSGVDATLGGAFTKTLFPCFRAHFSGKATSANGNGIGGDEGNRRNLLWEAGPGVDYQICESALITLNYLNRVGEEVGEKNANILEAGWAQYFPKQGCTEQFIKLAVDVGLDGHETTDNLGAKFEWGIEWK